MKIEMEWLYGCAISDYRVCGPGIEFRLTLLQSGSLCDAVLI